MSVNVTFRQAELHFALWLSQNAVSWEYTEKEKESLLCFAWAALKGKTLVSYSMGFT